MAKYKKLPKKKAQPGITLLPEQLEQQNYDRELEAYQNYVQQQNTKKFMDASSMMRKQGPLPEEWNNNWVRGSSENVEEFQHENANTSMPEPTNADKLETNTPRALGRKGKGQINWGTAALTGLMAVDALLPQERSPWPVVRPKMSYNEHPYGTGSQAIAKHGITLSTTGYKSNSKDKNKKQLRIPSNHITMKDVDIPLQLVASNGQRMQAYPGDPDVIFPKSVTHVDEFPMAQDGGTLPSDYRNRWNSVLNYAKTNMGYTSKSKELDHMGTTQKILSQYNKANPNSQFQPDWVPSVQEEFTKVNADNKGFSERRKLGQGVGYNTKTSKYDGIIGRLSIDQPYVGLEEQTFNNGVQTSNVDRGLLAPGFTPTGSASSPFKKSIPKGVATMKDKEGMDYYTDPNTGNLVQMGKGGSLSASKAKEMLRDGKANGKKLTKKQKGYFGLIAGGGTPHAENGMTILDEDTVEFTGDKHSDPSGGQPISYGGKSVMVEGGETGYKSPVDDSLTVFSMKTKNPLTGNSFSRDSKNLAEKEEKMNELLGEGFELIDNNKPMDKWGSLKFNAGKVMMEGAAKKKKELTTSKEHLKAIQQAMLDMSQEAGVEPHKMTAAHYGAVMQNGGTTPPGAIIPSLKEEQSSRFGKADIYKYEYPENSGMAAEESYPAFNYNLPLLNKGKFTADANYWTGLNKDTIKSPYVNLNASYTNNKGNTLAASFNPLKADPYNPKVSVGYTKNFQDGGTIIAQPGATVRAPIGQTGYLAHVDPPKKWKYNNTNTKGLDEKIQVFTDMLIAKGLTGYSGEQSGVSDRNTLSGNASRHMTGEALDAFFDQPDAYEKILGDPELSGYLINNGMTAIDEYNPKVAKKTGATAGHVHIGYDRGTSTADQFRKDAASKYKSANPTWSWGNTRAPKGKAKKGVPAGDAQYFPYQPADVPTWKDLPTEGRTPVAPTKLPETKFNFQNPQPYDMPSNAEGLELTQILPELYGAATNRVEPVFMQQFQPELFEPYQVSFQDQLNENQASFSSMSKAAAYNPSALATLAGQKYSADSGVLANEFRTNQGIANEITNKNIALLNESQSKNLGLADIQYGRQETAKSNTKAIDHGILNSISSKILQNEANNNKLQLYENLYRFRFDPKNNYQAYNAGPSGNEFVDYSGLQDVDNNGLTPYQSMKQNYNNSGQPTTKSINTPAMIDQQLKQHKLWNETSIYPNVNKLVNKNLPSIFNNWGKK